MDERSRELALRWVRKAESDWLAVSNLAAGDPVPWDVVCFHCQQTAEKYLKAVLIASNVEFEPIHDLLRLARLGRDVCPELQGLIQRLGLLTQYSVQVRYPDDWPEVDAKEGADTVEDARVVREALQAVVSARLGERRQ